MQKLHETTLSQLFETYRVSKNVSCCITSCNFVSYAPS